ncbi:hypothetical protein [Streptomyces asiaticus]|uniref:hypothetical protein n=1 Tax=Streptomyces asiaticus TaxID=114695 RepID=UPI003F67FBD4
MDGTIWSSGTIAGVGELVGDQGEMGQLGQFLSADAGVAEGFDGCPGPEGVVFYDALVDPAAGAADLLDVNVLGPVVQAAGDLVDLRQDAQVAGAFVLEDLFEGGGAGGFQQRGRFASDALGGLHQNRQVVQAFTDALVHP